MLSSILVASGEIVVVIGGIVGGGGGIAQLPVKMESDERAHYDDIVLPLLSMAATHPLLRPTRLRYATTCDGRPLLSFTVAVMMVVVRSSSMVAATQKLNEDARFSFPDRRHSSYSGVYLGVLRSARVRGACACVQDQLGVALAWSGLRSVRQCYVDHTRSCKIDVVPLPQK